jgi:hypothetical protein
MSDITELIVHLTTRCADAEVRAHELESILAELAAEIKEQARLLGLGGSKEAALLAERNRYREALVRINNHDALSCGAVKDIAYQALGEKPE